MITRQVLIAIAGVALAFGPMSFGQSDVTISPQPLNRRINCDEKPGSVFCADRYTRTNYDGEYVGHDEPALIFYSNTPGSGNQSIYNLILPKDPPTPPKQDGTGGTYNFQLHPAFWFGMAICDTQSAPNPNKNGTCVPDSDANIFESTNKASPNYIGNHPGTAFLELQFYPPGWIASPGISVSNAYYAALNIDSFSFNMNTNRNNNADCLNQVGQEPVNFAIITKNGVPLFPANPLNAPIGVSKNDLRNVLLMSPGDVLRVAIQDSPDGVLIAIQDLTTGQSGTMTGGPTAGFGQVDWNPAGATCTVSPYAFRPMYSTSSESTRVPWAVHSYNIAFSDEIGHFELCDAFNGDPNSPNFLQCTSPGAGSFKLDADDFPCANPAFFGFPPSFIPITGCIGEDLDFNGISYGKNWPGSDSNPSNILRDPLLRPAPIQFSSPQFMFNGVPLNFDQVAFETDLPAFEAGCNTRTGAGCVNPPQGAAFYPIFTTGGDYFHRCWWQLGGANIPSTTNTFGGTPAAEYGDLLTLAYPTPFGAIFDKGNFHRTVPNSCQVFP